MIWWVYKRVCTVEKLMEVYVKLQMMKDQNCFAEANKIPVAM